MGGVHTRVCACVSVCVLRVGGPLGWGTGSNSRALCVNWLPKAPVLSVAGVGGQRGSTRGPSLCLQPAGCLAAGELGFELLGHQLGRGRSGHLGQAPGTAEVVREAQASLL